MSDAASCCCCCALICPCAPPLPMGGLTCSGARLRLRALNAPIPGDTCGVLAALLARLEHALDGWLPRVDDEQLENDEAPEQ